jgi:hypothetical protein
MSSKESARDPLPQLWCYKHNDADTWPYLDCIISGKGSKDKLYVTKWIRNPEFKFKHLLKE